jgi:hypothetical protein
VRPSDPPSILCLQLDQPSLRIRAPHERTEAIKRHRAAHFLRAAKLHWHVCDDGSICKQPALLQLLAQETLQLPPSLWMQRHDFLGIDVLLGRSGRMAVRVVVTLHFVALVCLAAVLCAPVDAAAPSHCTAEKHTVEGAHRSSLTFHSLRIQIRYLQVQ